MVKSPEHPTSFAHRLRWARERAGLTQLELGVRAGLEPKVAAPRINQYENGVHEPRVETAQALADALGIPPAFLYTTDEELAGLLLVWADLESDERRKLLKSAEAQLKSQKAKKRASRSTKSSAKKAAKKSA
ncbi:MAG: XRE family transcriptional regulator [Lysobacter sp.]|nr:MAG: XRE family transcriptional regulator [Lysobacter sp.]